MLSSLLNPETGVISLEHRFPRCPVCDGQKEYSERLFIRLNGMCQSCEGVHVPTIIRKKGKKNGKRN